MPEILIRHAVPSDLEALVELETRAMHFPMGHRIREWLRDDFPADHRDRIAVAEHQGRLVSAAALIPFPVRYRGIDLSAAYWDAVVTEEAYRRQGLCRRLFAHLTSKSDADALFVWGATWLYRRLGYFPALRHYGGLGCIERIANAADAPPSTLAFRPATPNDAVFLARLRADAGARYVASHPATEASFRHDLRPDRVVAGPEQRDLNRWQEWRVLEKGDEPVGYFMHDPWDLAVLMELEIVPDRATWREAAAAAIKATAEFPPAPCFRPGDVRAALPESHPAYEALPRLFGPAARPSGDIAARIPDPAAFLRKVATALENLLASSSMAGSSGELTISLIEAGLKLQFESGRLLQVEPWQASRPDEARVRLMPGCFEGLVFGYRTVGEILDVDPDCHADEESEALLSVLFPKGDSFLRPI